MEEAPAGVEPFEAMAGLRAQVIEDLGLSGEDRMAAAAEGAGYPGALVVLADALRRAHCRTVADLGGGLGGASQWLAEQIGAMVTVVERSPASALAGRRLFPERPVIIGGVDAVPLATASVDAVTLLGVVSLVPDDAPLLDEAARLLRPGGLLALSDLCLPGGDGRGRRGDVARPPNVFRSTATLATDMTRRGMEVIGVWEWTDDGDATWGPIEERVAHRLAERDAGSGAVRRWREDQARLARVRREEGLVVASLVARLRSSVR